MKQFKLALKYAYTERKQWYFRLFITLIVYGKILTKRNNAEKQFRPADVPVPKSAHTRLLRLSKN